MRAQIATETDACLDPVSIVILSRIEFTMLNGLSTASIVVGQSITNVCLLQIGHGGGKILGVNVQLGSHHR